MENKNSIIIGISGLFLIKEEINLLKSYLPIGVILFSRNIESNIQVEKLINNIKKILGESCLILIDQEGGRVQRLKYPNCPNYPAINIFGKIAEESMQDAQRATYLNYLLLGNDLLKVGINVNCAPCLDLESQNTHSVIGNRSFSSNPIIVSLLGESACNGLLDSGVLPIIKHIPGHGRASSDSHLSLPIILDKIEFLEKNDFLPFKNLSRIPLAMTAHILYKELDNKWPITQSKLANNYIRNILNYEGILVSDDIEMSALSGSINDKVKSIYNAGCDIILHCSGKIDTTKQALVSSKKINKKLSKKLELCLIQVRKTNKIIDRDSNVDELENIFKKYLFNINL
jgi:beta-N-acetylhexosaminidase